MATQMREGGNETIEKRETNEKLRDGKLDKSTVSPPYREEVTEED